MNDYTDQLRALGFRSTPQRLAILKVMDDARGHLAPSEIVDQVQQNIPGINESTVYRTLELLVREGLILDTHLGSGQIVYEVAHTKHHHLLCRNCGKEEVIQGEELADLYAHFERHTGYQIDSVHMTFFGLCPDCQQKPGE
jgi:Fur family ferric uptake transcriptional regulator